MHGDAHFLLAVSHQGNCTVSAYVTLYCAAVHTLLRATTLSGSVWFVRLPQERHQVLLLLLLLLAIPLPPHALPCSALFCPVLPYLLTCILLYSLPMPSPLPLLCSALSINAVEAGVTWVNWNVFPRAPFLPTCLPDNNLYCI